MKILSLILMFCWLLPAAAENLPPQKPVLPDGVSVPSPGNDLWREVRQRDGLSPGISQVRQVDSGVLINPLGDQWARFRVNQLAPYSGIAIIVVFCVLLLFFLVKGRMKIEGGPSGDMVLRYTGYERFVHWTLAIVFLFLAITGLILLLGRPLLIPLLGKPAFGTLAWLSKEGHNLLGPLFLLSLLVMLFSFGRRNLYQKGDLTWMLKGGGFIGDGHVSAGFFNMGEKFWFWMVIFIGLVIAGSGLVLLFPSFGQTRVVMEASHLVHVIGAATLIAVSFGHMYIGSIGTEGALEGMTSGYVDIKWADSHHDRWGKECHDQKLIVSAADYIARTSKQPQAQAKPE